MVRVFREEKVETVDLQQIEDGVYQGSFGDFMVSVTLDVTVSDRRITDIDIVDQHCGPGYSAEETVGRIIEAQNPCVDAVSGATGSSRCIMITVHKALSD